jgi:hypothetical protein
VSDEERGDGRNFRGQDRKNDTHASTTDPDARLYRKSNNAEARLAYLGHVLYDTADFVAQVRQVDVTPHVAQNDTRAGGSAIDATPAPRTAVRVRPARRMHAGHCSSASRLARAGYAEGIIIRFFRNFLAIQFGPEARWPALGSCPTRLQPERLLVGSQQSAAFLGRGRPCGRGTARARQAAHLRPAQWACNQSVMWHRKRQNLQRTGRW